ncbi:torsin-1A-interacting protein 1-like isoform X1 [Poecilia formosa]|uniref:Torsin-1A-interacting protein 1-like n=1 Tax=Poecilia formosa TaxID=48698 RepID=A0A087YSB4_POEFO|nr:PREDICTED: torsin-1A-interacting protein 1-like isoform X1 [Poecilia formosa]
MDSKAAKNKAPGQLRRSLRQTGKVLGVEPTPRGPLKRTRKTSEPQSSPAAKGAKNVENGLDEEESPPKKYRLDAGEGHDDNLSDDDMEVQESVKDTENGEDLEMDVVEEPLKETSQPKTYKDHYEFVNLSPRVVLHKSNPPLSPYEDSQGMKTKKAEVKAPSLANKAHSHVKPAETRPAMPITSMDEYKRKMEAKARSAATSSLVVPRPNQVSQRVNSTSEKIYPTKPHVNNIPDQKKADQLTKQDGKKKTAGTEISSGNSCRGFFWYLWRLLLLVLLSSATLLAYRILPVLQSKAGGGGGQRSREAMPERFSDSLSLLQSQFPSQREELWRRTQIHLEKHLKTAEPTEPVSLILVAGLKAERTLLCLARGLASAYSSALNGSAFLIDGVSKAGQDSDKVKLDVDNQLQAAFEGDKPAAVIHRFEELPPGSTIIFYRYCDHETAAYKQAFLLFTALLPQDEIDSELSLNEVEELVLSHVKAKLVDSEGKASFNEMDIDKFGGLWSRISHVILPVVSEVNQEECQ